MSSERKGFTTMELLIVIALIGILATIIILFVNSARAKGRDAQRMSDIEQIRTAIELYIIDNGVAPDMFAVDKESSWNNLSALLVPTYIPTLPIDPCGLSPSCTTTTGGTNGSWFAYVYKGPTQLINEGTGAYFGIPIGLNKYVILAENLESKKGESFGFGPSSF